MSSLRVEVGPGPYQCWHARLFRGSEQLCYEYSNRVHVYCWRNGAEARIAGKSIKSSPQARKWGRYADMPMGARAAHWQWVCGWKAADAAEART